MKRVPEEFRNRLRMKEKLDTEEGRQIYDMRKYIIEPVIGDIKYNLGLDEFALRGLDLVRLELNLASIAHNLKKIWKAKLELNINMNKNEIILDFWIMSQKLNVTQPVKGAVFDRPLFPSKSM